MSQDIINKIIESGKITEDELKVKIKAKMRSLSGLISEEGAAHIIANELGVVIPSAAVDVAGLKIKDITAGMRSVNVVAKVIRKYEIRTFGEDGSGKVGNLLMGDETGITRLTFWNDKTEFFEKITEGDVVEVQNAYSRENNDRVEVHMGNSSNCIINPEGITIVLKERSEGSTTENLKKISEITGDDNYIDVMATIVQIYDPRFFESCPECGKKMQAQEGGFVCATHGKQEPSYNYVMNIFLDDGTDNIRAALWKDQIHQLLETTAEDMLKIKDDAEKIEDIKNDLLGRIIKARAKVRKNEAYNQIELVLYNVNPNPNPEEAMESSEKAEIKTAPKKAASVPVEPESTQENMSGEVIDEDDEIFSVDDIDEELGL